MDMFVMYIDSATELPETELNYLTEWLLKLL